MAKLRDMLETHQVAIYLVTVVCGPLAALAFPSTERLEPWINPALAVMLFATFLMVPLADLGRSLRNFRFLGALCVANFILIPALVFGLVQFLPSDPLVRIGVLLVLLAPCIDYVVTFAHIGKANARLLLATTPVLLLLQMLLLPVYLSAFLGRDAVGLIHIEPFIHAFIWLIVAPLALAGAVQMLANRSNALLQLKDTLGLLPVPATALVLFVVIASVAPQMGQALDGALTALPLYLAFAVLAPSVGWLVGRIARLETSATRAVAFSSATRNSLVVLPLAFAIPDAAPLLPAVIVTQTLVELVASLAYMRILPLLGNTAIKVR